MMMIDECCIIVILVLISIIRFPYLKISTVQDILGVKESSLFVEDHIRPIDSSTTLLMSVIYT